MDTVYYLIIVSLIAFFTVMELTSGSLRIRALIILALLVILSIVNVKTDLRSRLFSLFWKDDRQTEALSKTGPQEVSAPKPFKPFYVYQDKNSRNGFVPSGYMPDGHCVRTDDGWQYGVWEGKTCTMVVYDTVCSLRGAKWAGIYWQNPANNWGDQKGGYDLRGATRLVFWARGERGGEMIKEFKVGGIGANHSYPDSDTAVLGPVTLTREWREYTIDLNGKELSSISGGFAWSASAEGNVVPCIFYLDDMRFE